MTGPASDWKQALGGSDRLGHGAVLMVPDQSVMNVSISQLVADFDTTVTTIQGVITPYCLVMAMLELTIRMPSNFSKVAQHC